IAVMSAAGIAAVFYVLATYVEVAGFHYSLKAITSAAAAPLFALGAPVKAGGYGGTWIDRLLELVGLLDMLAGAHRRARVGFPRRLPSPPSGTARRWARLPSSSERRS